MEISGNLHSNLYPVPAENRSRQEQRIDERETTTTRNTEPGPLKEYISRGEVVQEKGSADYREALAQLRRRNSTDGTARPGTTTATSRNSQQALEAYLSNASAVDNGGVELLPRVDNYV